MEHLEPYHFHYIIVFAISAIILGHIVFEKYAAKNWIPVQAIIKNSFHKYDGDSDSLYVEYQYKNKTYQKRLNLGEIPHSSFQNFGKVSLFVNPRHPARCVADKKSLVP